jgi:predicted ATPase
VEAVQALTGRDEVHRIDLAELDLDQIDRLLQAVLRGPVTRRAVRELYAVSGGNLLYLHELVHGALTSGALRRNDHLWELAAGSLPRTSRLTE